MLRVITAIVLAALASTALAKPPTSNERYLLGRYVVRRVNSDRMLCRVRIGWANDVGGEFTASGCKSIPTFDSALRWWFDDNSGEARFEDALHKVRFKVVETDAGFVAITPADEHYWFDPAPPPPRPRSSHKPARKHP